MTKPENQSDAAKDLQQILQLQQRAIEFAEAGMTEEAVESAVVSLGLLEEVDPENLLLKAKLIQNTSRVLLYANDLDQAVAIAQEGVEIMLNLPSCPQDQLAAALLNLSSIQYAQKQFKHASETLTEAMRIWEQLVGWESAQVADCLNNLARIREEQGDHMKGAELHQEAIDIKKTVFGDHEQTAFSWMSKGLALMEAKAFSQAAEALQEAVDCCQRANCIDGEVGKACTYNLELCQKQLQQMQ